MRMSKRFPSLFLMLMVAIVSSAALAPASSAQVAVGISVHIGPPALPVYAQPPCPADGYLWTPGYWAYGPVGYYWVPGVWVAPPRVGVLWTPGYWGFAGGPLWVACRLLGTARRLLRWHQLRLRLRWRRILWAECGLAASSAITPQ